MTISRRGLFGLLAAAPVAAVRAAEPKHIGSLNAGSITWPDGDYSERVGEVLRPIPIRFPDDDIGRRFYILDGTQICVTPKEFANTGQPDQSAPVPSHPPTDATPRD